LELQEEVCSELGDEESLVVAMDDSLIRKTGKKIHGVKYQRDPLSPPFHTNLALSQRFVQLSAALPNTDGSADVIPIDFLHAPLPTKPRKKASQQEWEEYESARKQMNINVYGARRLNQLRQTVASNRRIVAVVDGRFTNSTILKSIPENTTLIGRVRSDANLFTPASMRTGKPGRPKIYEAKAPTPKELLKDKSFPWLEVNAFAVGKERTFSVKKLSPVIWKSANSSNTFQLVVVAPVGYRLKKGSKILRREPAFLLCSDPNMPVQEVLQQYLWRWGIENNFRDEKTLLGMGQAQVRKQASCQKAPALAVAAYAILLLAARKTSRKQSNPTSLPLPKWRRNKSQPSKPSTAQLINQLRVDLWSSAIDQHLFRDFSTNHPPNQNPQKFLSPLKSAAFSAMN